MIKRAVAALAACALAASMLGCSQQAASEPEPEPQAEGQADPADEPFALDTPVQVGPVVFDAASEWTVKETAEDGSVTLETAGGGRIVLSAPFDCALPSEDAASFEEKAVPYISYVFDVEGSSVHDYDPPSPEELDGGWSMALTATYRLSDFEGSGSVCYYELGDLCGFSQSAFEAGSDVRELLAATECISHPRLA